MGFRIRPLAATMAVAFSSSALMHGAIAQSDPMLDDIVVSAQKPKALPESTAVNPNTLSSMRAASSDTASLLRDVPGVYLQSAGGVSSLPSLHGLADDRLRIQVDGMDLVSACANHMNPPLSSIDPSNVDSVRVYAGITPVSAGGDSIGGTIIVNSTAPRFANPGEGLQTSGQLGAFYRSNGNAWGANASASIASENISIRYSGSTAESGNYTSAKDFKPGTLATYTTAGSHWIPGNEVGSTAYKTENHQLAMAYRLDNHVLDLKLGYQHIPYQGFPNQHMDMTHNESKQVNLGYTGRFAWGRLEGRVYHEETQHEMNFLEDKLYWYGAAHNVAGMPMNTDGKNTGLALKAEIIGSDRDLFRVGSEYQHYRLSDWWAPVDHSPMMSPNTFWNINNGQRDRFDVFGEWEAAWSTQWMTLIGARSSTVMMDTGTVQGYNASYNPSAFNNAERSRTDHNIDLSALARFTPDARQTYEGGYSRKTRSPSLYERYTWSTNGMAMTMNNWVNDGNGYVGNLDLKPEVAHTLSFSADWHDAGKALWNVRITPYYSLVNNYIDAQCLAASCPSNQYNYLTLINQDANLYGLDLSGFAALGTVRGIGSFTARGMIAYVRGKNRDTGDYLYNIMPLNARLTLEHRLGNWTNTIEEQLVSAKDDVSRTRSEISTSGYSLLNLRSSYEWKNVRVDIGLDNALDKQYALPLGGAYIGQGMTMSIGPSTTWSGTTRPPYGYAVPGMGRSLFAAVTIKF